MRIFICILIIIGAAALMIRCSTPQNSLKPTESDINKIKADYPKASLSDLQTGLNLYKRNCSGCHILYLPNSKTREQWEKLLPEMFSRTFLNKHEQELITQYIFAKSI